MGLYAGFRFVYVLKCEDEDDFYNFRLKIAKGQEFTQTWEDDEIPMFGLKTKSKVSDLDVHLYDPDDDPEGQCLPYHMDRQAFQIYMFCGFTDPLSMRQLDNRVKVCKETLKALKRLFPDRKPTLHIEPYWT